MPRSWRRIGGSAPPKTRIVPEGCGSSDARRETRSERIERMPVGEAQQVSFSHQNEDRARGVRILRSAARIDVRSGSRRRPREQRSGSLARRRTLRVKAAGTVIVVDATILAADRRIRTPWNEDRAEERASRRSNPKSEIGNPKWPGGGTPPLAVWGWLNLTKDSE